MSYGQSITFEKRRDADHFVRMLDVFGGDGNKASAAVAGANPSVKAVREVMLAYIDANHRASLAQLRKYRNQVRDHFDDTLGHTPIDRVDADTVQAWVVACAPSGSASPTRELGAPRSIRSAPLAPPSSTRLACCRPRPSGTCTACSRRRLNGRCSVACVPTIPVRGCRCRGWKRVGDEMCLLTHEEFDLLHDAMSPRYQLLLRTMVGTGLRWGEITALQVMDVQQSSEMVALRVNKAWKRDGEHQHHVGSTRTSRSRRTVPDGETLGRDLLALAEGRGPDELLFVNARGTQIRHNTFWCSAARSRVSDHHHRQVQPPDAQPAHRSRTGGRTRCSAVESTKVARARPGQTAVRSGTCRSPAAFSCPARSLLRLGRRGISIRSSPGACRRFSTLCSSA